MLRFARRTLAYLIVIMAVVSFAACSASKEPESEGIKKLPVEVAPVTEDSIESVSRFMGLVKPRTLAYVVSSIPGKVSSAFFEVGDRVRKGDLLFTIDSTEIEDGILVLEEQLKAAEANLSLAGAGVAAAMGSQYESQKIQLEATLKSSEDNFAAAKEAFDSAALLLYAGLINRPAYNQIKNQYEQAQNALDAAIDSYELYETKIAESARKTADEQFKQARASYDMLNIQIESARKKLSYTKVTSPMDGTVASKEIVPGCMISNTMIPYIIIDSDTVQVEISVTEQAINKIRKGERLDILIPSASEEPFKGVVSTVSPAVDEKTLTYGVLIEVGNRENRIRPGMTSKVSLITERHENTMIVPASSVLISGNENVVYIVEDNRAVKKTVTVGISDGDRIEITAGVKPGDLLVIKGQQLLSHHHPVMITGGNAK